MNERRKVVKRGLSVLFICSYILCCVGLCDVFLFSPLDTEMLMDLLNNSAIYCRGRGGAVLEEKVVGFFVGGERIIEFLLLPIGTDSIRLCSG